MTDLMPSPTPYASAPARRHRGRWTVAIAVAALFVAACLAWQWIDHGLSVPVSVVVDGQPWSFDGDVAALPWSDKAAIAGGIAVALVAVPLALGAALFAVVAALVLVLLLAVALPLLLGSAVLAVVPAPLWLLVWLLWRAVMPRRSATIGA